MLLLLLTNDMNFFHLLKNHGNAEGGYNFVPEKMFSSIKGDFFSSFVRFQGVNIKSR